MYDYLIIGSGLFGSICAYEAHKRGKKCLVIEKRNHLGGNIYCEEHNNIKIHKYGAHIFHTSNEQVWEYINQFTHFNNFINSPMAIYKDEIYNLPFNMNTFSKMWGITKPEDAKKIIEEQCRVVTNKPQNLEEQAISLVGIDIYQKLIKGYTEKQWGKNCEELPAFIIKRLPVRFTYDNNYFNDKYQGIPIGGYTKLVEKMLEGIEVKLEEDFLEKKDYYKSIAKKVVYTGMLDEYFDCRLGRLEYRSLRFDTKVLDMENFQGNAVVNYTGREVDYTRVIEHKHFESTSSKKTVVTYEYPDDWTEEKEAYYVINDDKNNNLKEQYQELAIKEKNVIFGGRLAEYKYYDMDDVIRSAMNTYHKIEVK